MSCTVLESTTLSHVNNLCVRVSFVMIRPTIFFSENLIKLSLFIPTIAKQSYVFAQACQSPVSSRTNAFKQQT